MNRTISISETNSDKRIRVLVLVPARCGTSPGQRFRIEQWIPHLESKGFEFSTIPFESESLHRVLHARGKLGSKSLRMAKSYLRRLGVVKLARTFDIIYLYREAALIGPGIIEHRLYRTGVPIVYDFDDPIWMSYQSPSNRSLSRLKCLGKTKGICERAHTVIVGNRMLKTWAEQHAARVEVVPATIELSNYLGESKRKPSQPITLGWMGSHSTLPFLKLIEGALQKLSRAARFRLLVVSHTNEFRIPDAKYEVESRKWSQESEIADLREMDIGLGPFPNEGWTPWRCHGKVLQYMASGIPTVASPVGVISDYITHGQEGFLAESEQGWVNRLEELIRGGDDRQRMGQKALEKIHMNYSGEIWAQRVGEILAGAAHSGQYNSCRATEGVICKPGALPTRISREESSASRVLTG